MELDEGRRGEGGPRPVRPPSGGGVAAHRQRGVEVDPAVAAGGQHDGVRGERADLPGDEVPGDDSLGAAVGDDEVEHLVAGQQGDGAGGDLPLQRVGRRHLHLLPGLPARVVGPGDLDPAEGAGVEGASVLAGEGGADGGEVVDDPGRLEAEPVDVGLAGPEVAAGDGVLDEAGDAVAVDLAAAGGVDPALRGDAVRAPGGVVEGQGGDVVAELAEGGRGGAPGQAGADDDHREAAAVERADQAVLEAASLPGGGRVAGRDPRVEVRAEGAKGVERCVDRCVDRRAEGARPGRGHESTPSWTATGMAPLPTTTASATAWATPRARTRVRRPVPPRSVTAIHSPCARCSPRASMATR